jgi:hypothetical protein
MSGALVSLVSKGVQDAYLTNNDGGSSFFQIKYSRHTNFSQAPKLMTVIGGPVASGGTSVVPIESFGDLVNGMWLYGGVNDQVVVTGVNSPPGLIGFLAGTIFELHIGGQLIDSHTFDYLSDIWSVYLAETETKRSMMNNFMTSNKTTPLNVDYTFFPLHFFFCDNEMFLPLVAIQFHPVEVHIRWGPYVNQMKSEPKVYCNYVFLDTKERELLVAKPMDILVTQVQRYTPGIHKNVDLSVFNHPVKSIYFGYPSVGLASTWTFDAADLIMNGTYLLEKMYPQYFHTVQGYYHSKFGNIQFSSSIGTPMYTQYYTYNFCMDATSYKPTGTCNFSRLDSSKLSLTNHQVFTVDGTTVDGSKYVGVSPFTIYAVNYNVLRIKDGLAGILFGN